MSDDREAQEEKPAKAEADAKPDDEIEGEKKPVPAESNADADVKASAKADADAGAKADADVKAGAKADADTKALPDASADEHVDADVKAKTKAGAEAADAKAKAEAADAKADDSLPSGMKKLAEGEWSESTDPALKKRDPLRLAPAWQRWAFAIVPVVGLVELVLHVRQTHAVVPDEDWKAARAAVAPQLKPDDLVMFAPKWSDPKGREMFGPDVMTFARSARPDETRFARAFEVGIHGEHRPEIATWKKVDEKDFGGVTVTTFDNPNPAKIKDDLVTHLGPEQTTVSRFDASTGAEQACSWTVGPTVSGGSYYPFGPATPGSKFTCQGTFAGVSIIQDLEHDPRLCILAPPIGGAAILRLRFANVAFGASLHGHHGLHYDAERHATGEIVSLVFRAGDKSIGRAEHRIGSGWTGFEFPTQDLAGQRGELTVDVIGRSQQRQYCFEADTR